MDNNKTKTPQQRRREAQMKRDTMQAYGVMTGMAAFIVVMVLYFVFFRSGTGSQAAGLPEVITNTTPPRSTAAPDDSQRSEDHKIVTTTTVTAEDPESPASESTEPAAPEHKLEVKDGITYVDGIMIVNKTYSLPASYAPGLDPTAKAAFDEMAAKAWGEGVSLYIISGYRSYAEQEKLYAGYAAARGTEEADRVSSRAGHSEHQSGLCMDVNTTEFSFEGTKEAIWLEQHCAEYGFIIRFPKNRESITGYEYEPWHIRYVGVEAATEIMSRCISLEEYLGVTSDYRYATDAAARQ